MVGVVHKWCVALNHVGFGEHCWWESVSYKEDDIPRSSTSLNFSKKADPFVTSRLTQGEALDAYHVPHISQTRKPHIWLSPKCKQKVAFKARRASDWKAYTILKAPSCCTHKALMTRLSVKQKTVEIFLVGGKHFIVSFPIIRRKNKLE